MTNITANERDFISNYSSSLLQTCILDIKFHILNILLFKDIENLISHLLFNYYNFKLTIQIKMPDSFVISIKFRLIESLEIGFK